MTIDQQKQEFHPAQIACEFMSRADIKGREVEAYAQTYNWLQGFLAGELVAVLKEDLEDLTSKVKSGDSDASPPEDASSQPDEDGGASDLDDVE